MATEPKEPIAESLLQRAHSPDTATTILREKVKQRPLLLRPTSPDPTLNARSKRQYERLQKAKARRKSNKPKPLSAKQKRALCIYDIPKSQQKYAIYEPLHRLWCGYMREILGFSGKGEGPERRTWIDGTGAGQLLVTADYHGAGVEVVRSRCVSRVGVKGIVVKETKFTFEVVTPRDELKVLPKEGTVFRVEVPIEDKGDRKGSKPVVFEIHGNQFEARAPDRAVKKFRPHFDPDL